MPSTKDKTGKPARSKSAKVAAASILQREAIMAWLSKSPKNAAAYLAAARELGNHADLRAAIRLIEAATSDVNETRRILTQAIREPDAETIERGLGARLHQEFAGLGDIPLPARHPASAAPDHRRVKFKPYTTKT